MTATSRGPIHWSLQRDDDGHRDYLIDFRVETTDSDDGPASVTWASGLPAVGTYWQFGNDLDFWAFCWPTLSATPEYDDEASVWWRVRMKFSTRPFKRCRDATIEDPLLEPPKISGGFNTRSRKTMRDRHDRLIKTSSHELVSLDVDEGNPTVNISMNIASLDLEVLSKAVHKLNDAKLWGLGSRHIKLNNATWERNLYGLCSYYFTVSYEFEAKFEGWDEGDIVDCGTRCLRGKWEDVGTASPPGPKTWVQDADVDKDNPAHFIVIKDTHDENYGSKVLLDGNGGRLTDPTNPVFLTSAMFGTASPGTAIELYDEFNFLELGIPTSLTT